MCSSPIPSLTLTCFATLPGQAILFSGHIAMRARVRACVVASVVVVVGLVVHRRTSLQAVPSRWVWPASSSALTASWWQPWRWRLSSVVRRTRCWYVVALPPMMHAPMMHDAFKKRQSLEGSERSTNEPNDQPTNQPTNQQTNKPIEPIKPINR